MRHIDPLVQRIITKKLVVQERRVIASSNYRMKQCWQCALYLPDDSNTYSGKCRYHNGVPAYAGDRACIEYTDKHR